VARLERRVSGTLVAVLALFFGIFGAHRFYVGKTGSAIVQLLTLGGLGIWASFDLIIILLGGFTDDEGSKITEWS
jgi:TM2 domain-containing membrane protein YozV